MRTSHLCFQTLEKFVPAVARGFQSLEKHHDTTSHICDVVSCEKTDKKNEFGTGEAGGGDP